jgi:hypothetical protein
LIVPTVVLPPAIPLTSHCTVWLRFEGLTAAENCCVVLIGIALLAGVTVTVGTAVPMLTVALQKIEGFTPEIALITTRGLLGAVVGAV